MILCLLIVVTSLLQWFPCRLPKLLLLCNLSTAGATCAAAVCN